MNIHDEFAGTWLKAVDLRGQDAQVIIERIEREEVGGDPKLVVYFRGKERGLVLNKTNATTISEHHGFETADWVGKPITMFPTQTDFRDKQVACIRIRLPETAGNGFEPLDDDIPF